jgi:hypothetical protein
MASKGGGSSGKSGTKTDIRKKQREARNAAFLEALGKLGVVTAAAKVAGINRQYVYELAKKDPTFAAAMEDALEQSLDLLELSLRRRGQEGVLEPVYYKGKLIGEIRKYSDTAAIFILKGRRKGIFGDNRVAVNVQADASTDSIARAIQAASRAMRGTVPEGDAAA